MIIRNNNTKPSKKIILVHQDKIQQYRIAIYNYLYPYLMKHKFDLEIISSGIEKGNTHALQFPYTEATLEFKSLKKEINKKDPDAIIYFVNLKNLYLFPLLFYAKLKGIKLIYWGHGINLNNKHSILNPLYHLEHSISDAIILYAPHLIKFVSTTNHNKIFIANNTLNTTNYDKLTSDRKEIFARYHINTSRNIVCVGRMQKRKRIFDLIEALKKIGSSDVGLILVGPDTEGILNKIEGKNIYKLGPIYGDEKIALLKSCDVFCLPGHVGLGIVDAFYCGLPIVTEAVDHAPEIFYFRNGVNGFMVPKGDINALSKKLRLLLTDDKLRQSFSEKAKEIIRKEGHINKMCQEFAKALQFVFQDELRRNCKK